MPYVLREYEPEWLQSSELAIDTGTWIWQHFGKLIDVQFPAPPTGNRWKLVSKGWVGQIPLPGGDRLILQPRVDLYTLAVMLSYAYDLPSLTFLSGLVGVTDVEGLYDALAALLAKQVLVRTRKGLLREYREAHEVLPYVRGRFDVCRKATSPWEVTFACRFDDHSAENKANQILCWTLHTILRQGVLQARTRRLVRQALLQLKGTVSLVPKTAEDCLEHTYDRLSEDYRPMHALCRFFLDSRGPGHDDGHQQMVPFLVNMPRLFERFVAVWMERHLPRGLRVKSQKQLKLGESDDLSFFVDLVVEEVATGRPVCLLDTKYKIAAKPSPADVLQVIAYAQLIGCPEAVLLYPVELKPHLDERSGNVHVRSLRFALDGDLDVSGTHFLNALLGPGLVTS